MFDKLKGLGSIAGMMKDLPKLKAKMEEVKAKLQAMTVSAETGGGAVRVVANGAMHVESIRVDPALIAGLVDASDPADREMAEDLIAGAVNAAMKKAREMAEQEMTSAASELGLPIPPGALGGMLG